MGTSFSARDNPVDFGVVPRVVEDVFAMIAGRPSEGVRCTVRVSYLEIYNEQVREAVLVAVGAHARAHARAGPSWFCTPAQDRQKFDTPHKCLWPYPLVLLSRLPLPNRVLYPVRTYRGFISLAHESPGRWDCAASRGPGRLPFRPNRAMCSFCVCTGLLMP